MEKARQAAESLRIMHRHFSAWYNIILARRLAYGKARALADWRLTLRVWNAWRSYVRSQHVTIETKRHEKNIVEETRKTEVARRHYYLATLRKRFNQWQDYVNQEQERKRLEQSQAETRSKMMNLLTAVAGGSLWSARDVQRGGGDIVLESVEEDSVDGRKSERREKSGHGAKSGKSVDEVVGRYPKIAWGENSSTPSSTARPHSGRSTVSTISTAQAGSHGQKIPTQAWQITRRHAQMTKEEMAKITVQAADPDGGDAAEQVFQHSDRKIRQRFGTQPWMNRHFSVNNMEHRFTAQQKLLREQQTALQEQKRIIQDLVLNQHQHQLLQQVQQNALQVQAAGHGKDVGSSPGAAGDSHTTSPAQTHNSKKRGAASKSASTVKVPNSAQNHSQQGDTWRSEGTTGRSEVSTAPGSDHSEATSRTHNNVKYLQILKNMEDRAADRARLKAERDAKRRQAEDQRLEKLKAEEEEMKRKAEEEKKARVSAFREKKRLEKQKEEEKQREVEQQRELTAKAEDHYRKALMKFRVLLPMKRLVQMAQERLSLAQQHHSRCMLRKAISAWKNYTDEMTLEKKELADTLHGYIVVRRYFRQWTRYKHRMIFLERRADRWYRDMLLPKMFEAWCKFTTAEKQEELDRQKVADEFYPRSLQRKTFHAWRRLPQELKRAAEREKMRAEMRKKVADLLPDFQPSVSSVVQSTDSTL